MPLLLCWNFLIYVTGIHIQSDLDTDTEIDILKQQPGEDQKEDDFFEFYE